MERKKGFLIIDEFERVEKVYNKGRYCVDWFTDGQNEYLFKKYDYLPVLNSYREKIYAKLATKLGMKNVGYDLAVYRGTYGVITKNCTNCETISMDQVIDNYKKKNSITSIFSEFLFNVQDLDNILTYLYGKESNYNRVEMHRNVMLYFYYQILSANMDLCSVNMSMEKSTFRLLPLYDFGSCGFVDLKNSSGDFFHFVFSNSRFLNYLLSALRDFLNYANPCEVEEFCMYLQTGLQISYASFIEEIEEETNIFIPDEVKSLVLKIANHFQNLDEEIQSFHR